MHTHPRVQNFVRRLLSNFDATALPAAIVDCTSRPIPAEDYRQIVFGRRPSPVILRGLGGHFPCGEYKWDSLRQVADSKVEVAKNIVEQEASQLEDMRLGDFMDLVEGICASPFAEEPAEEIDTDEPTHLLKGHPYVYINQNFGLQEALPSLTNDVQAFRSLYPRHITLDSSLWIGPVGSITGLHCDHDYNTLLQLSGRKTMLLVPYEQADLIYPSKKFDMGATLSQVDLRVPTLNHKKFPKLRRATPYIAELTPGDMLSIPRRWFHLVLCTEGPSFSLTVHANTPITLAWERTTMLAHEWGLHGVSHGCTCHGAEQQTK
eukprot:NODE_1013_length_1165_cov_277.119176_g769_i0.p1 GENE.NODE_1013_length_1165_cov_277.119176_g769_i0~~NODE_1013_length_1165_cov_277.119176_g769_i0.p1  ORF type:complete len:340 (-),score=53.28 NODE_1013_length_1165_cov_277.119176_g769_i0:145-1104(-)